MRSHARVVAYSSHPSDTKLSLMVECRTCGIEWGWCIDSRECKIILEGLAREHDRNQH